jgi:hypothetical protein
MRRAMAGREIGGNNERRDLASVFSPMPSAAWFWRCDSRSYASSGPASNRLPPSVAAAGLFSCRSSDHLNSTGNQSVVKQCGAQWQAAKAGRTTGGATWPQFLKSCRAQLASTTSAPPSGGFTPAPAPAPAPSPAPTQSGSLFPWQRPATAPVGSAASTGGGSASAQAAQYRCPGSTVV